MSYESATAKSEKLATIPNAITIASGALAIEGLIDGIDTPKGLFKYIAGKSGDTLDGLASRRLLGTKLGKFVAKHIDSDRLTSSKSGAILDPFVDRVTNAGGFVEAWRKNTVPRSNLTVMGLLEASKAAASAVDFAKHPDERDNRRPTYPGKIGTFLHVASIGLYSAEKILDGSDIKTDRTKKTLRLVAETAFLAGTVLNGIALTTYIKRAKGEE